jgi:uncharacterized protein
MTRADGFDRVIESWRTIRDEHRAGVDDDSPDAAFREAEELWEQGRPEEAKEPYEQAARAGHAQAAFQLGWLYLNEDNDRASARKWWWTAASQHHAEAAFRLADLLWTEGNTDDAADLFRQAAEEGYAHASYQLGWLELNERNDPSAAKQSWERGALEEDHDSALQLAEHLVSDEPDEAKVWYQQAAESGNGYAAYQLGQLLDQEGNRDEAVTWMNVAKDEGEPQAAAELERWEDSGVDS